jgi:hypothetical protein
LYYVIHYISSAVRNGCVLLSLPLFSLQVSTVLALHVACFFFRALQDKESGSQL